MMTADTVANALADPGRVTQILATGDILLKVDRDTVFESACELYPDRKIEMDAEGNIIVAPLRSEDSSYRSMEAARQLANWAVRDGSGRAFDATSTFNLPSGAKRQPDAAWVPRSVLQREGSETLKTVSKTRHVPHFLIEVVSPSDGLDEQKAKCQEWIGAGVTEVFLVDPASKTVWVYGSSGDVNVVENAKVVASAILPGFVLDCPPLWEELG